MKSLLNRLIKFWRRPLKQWNAIIDSVVQSLPNESLKHFYDLEIVNCSAREYHDWLKYSDFDLLKTEYPHKKALEFFFSCKILNLCEEDHVLDAGGGRSRYIEMVGKKYKCGKLYLSDHIYDQDEKEESGKGVFVAGGDISRIGLPDSSLSKISCHHAFEHFQGDKDIAFILEIGRLLKPGGRACIIPLFITDRYVECWNIDGSVVFDKRAELVVDKSASIPGSAEDGHFARLYDVTALNDRIVATAHEAKLHLALFVCKLDGEDLPDMEKNFGSRLNYPLRALVLDKLQ